jgi:hypothetical protein
MEELELIIAPYMAKIWTSIHQLEKPFKGFIGLKLGGKKKKKTKLHSFLIFPFFSFLSSYLLTHLSLTPPTY